MIQSLNKAADDVSNAKAAQKNTKNGRRRDFKDERS